MNNLNSDCTNQALLNFVGDANHITLRTHFHPSVSLVAVLLGDDFIAGINESSGQWWCAKLETVTSLVAQCLNDSSLPSCRFHNGSLTDFLGALPKPILIQAGENTFAVETISGAWALLVGNTGRAVPVSSLNQFVLLEAPDQAMAGLAA